MIRILLATFLSLSLTSCVAFLAGGAAGAGAISYLRGELQSTIGHDINRTWRATESAVAQLQFQVTEASADQTTGKLLAKNAAGTDVTIRLKRETENMTEVKIRVGVMGDRQMSEQILDQIKANL